MTSTLAPASTTAQVLARRTKTALAWATEIGHSTDYLGSLVARVDTLNIQGWDWQDLRLFRQAVENALTSSRDGDLTMYLMLVHASYLKWKTENGHDR